MPERHIPRCYHAGEECNRLNLNGQVVLWSRFSSRVNDTSLFFCSVFAVSGIMRIEKMIRRHRTKPEFPQSTDVSRASGIVLPDVFCTFGWFYLTGLFIGGRLVFGEMKALRGGCSTVPLDGTESGCTVDAAEHQQLLFRRIAEHSLFGAERMYFRAGR